MPVPLIAQRAPLTETRPGQDGFTFTRRYPGASPDELWFITKRALKKNTDDGHLTLTVDETCKRVKAEGSALGFSAAVSLQIDGETVTVMVVKYPSLMRGKVDQTILRLLDRVPERLAELRGGQLPAR